MSMDIDPPTDISPGEGEDEVTIIEIDSDEDD